MPQLLSQSPLYSVFAQIVREYTGPPVSLDQPDNNLTSKPLFYILIGVVIVCVLLFFILRHRRRKHYRRTPHA